MTSYQDKYDRFHHKPTILGAPSSNNGWLYSAYAHVLGLRMSSELIQQCFDLCKKPGPSLKIDRNPDQDTPPLSRDEVLGLVCLGFLELTQLEKNHWQFCNFETFIPGKIPWSASLRAAWRIRKGHRNDLWKEPDLWRLGFSLPLQDRWYVIKKSKKIPPLWLSLFFHLSSFFTVLGKSPSGKLILWMKLKDLNQDQSWPMGLLNVGEVMKEYFPTGHPIREKFLSLEQSPEPKLK